VQGLDPSPIALTARNHFSEGANQSFGIELISDYVVRAVALDRHAIVADIGNMLGRDNLLDFAAHPLRFFRSSLTFHIDQDQVIVLLRYVGQHLAQRERGDDLESMEPEDIVTELAQGFPAANVVNRRFLITHAGNDPGLRDGDEAQGDIGTRTVLTTKYFA
jgi:uncharacterized protein YijF (DUF1287 family)